MTCIGENAEQHAGNRLIEVGIFVNYVRGLATQFKHAGDQALGSDFCNLAATVGTAGESDHTDVRMCHQWATNIGPIARHHVQDARRKADFQGQAAILQAHHGGDLRGLQNDCVTGSECRRQLLGLKGDR